MADVVILGHAIAPTHDAIFGGAIVKGQGYLPAREGTLVYLDAGNDLSTVLMRVEAACQELATCTIRTDTTFSFTVALRPHRPLVEAA